MSLAVVRPPIRDPARRGDLHRGGARVVEHDFLFITADHAERRRVGEIPRMRGAGVRHPRLSWYDECRVGWALHHFASWRFRLDEPHKRWNFTAVAGQRAEMRSVRT